MRTAYRLGSPLVVNQIGPVPKPPSRQQTGNSSSHQCVRLSPGWFRVVHRAQIPISGEMPPEGMSVEQAAQWALSGQTAGADGNSGATDPRWDIMRSVLDDLGRYGAKVGAFFAAETGTEPGAHLAELIDTSAEAYVAVALNPGTIDY